MCTYVHNVQKLDFSENLTQASHWIDISTLFSEIFCEINFTWLTCTYVYNVQKLDFSENLIQASHWIDISTLFSEIFCEINFTMVCGEGVILYFFLGGVTKCTLDFSEKSIQALFLIDINTLLSEIFCKINFTMVWGEGVFYFFQKKYVITKVFLEAEKIFNLPWEVEPVILRQSTHDSEVNFIIFFFLFFWFQWFRSQKIRNKKCLEAVQ